MNATPKSESNNPSRQKQRWALGGLIAAASASVMLSISAWAGGEDGARAAAPAPGMHAPGHGMGMPFDGRHLQRMLDDAKASDAQRIQIKNIAEKARADLKALHEQGKGLHEEALKLWAAPTLDPKAAEQLRQRMTAQHDKVSKRMLQAALDIGNVLTPEQRATVADQLRKQHEGMMNRFEFHREHHRDEQGASATPEGR